MAALGAVLTALKETPGPERVTTRAFVIAIINDSEGDSPTETKRLRLFMRRVLLEEVPVDQALTKAGFKVGRVGSEEGAVRLSGEGDPFVSAPDRTMSWRNSAGTASG